MSAPFNGPTMRTESTTWVIPCFNEAARFRSEAFGELVNATKDISLLFVNDGSSDNTERVLRSFGERNPIRVTVVSLPANRGKAEAVRHGLLRALADGADIVGYADADLATPVDELIRLVNVLRSSDASGLLGARVALLGRHIERKARRHYLGRVFSTAASLALSLPVYDTQCGAKLFRRTVALERALSTPFLSRWAFDVELLGRLVAGNDGHAGSEIIEEPLREWRDIAGSKLGPVQMIRSAFDLVRIAFAIRS